MTTTVDTNNWDAVYATHFSTLNQSIASQWKPINMQFTDTDESLGVSIEYILNATFAPWQLALGGDGKNVRFICPIQSGTFSSQTNGSIGKSYSFPTTGALTTIAIEVGMEWVPDSSQQFFAIADKSTVDTIVAALDSQTMVPTALVQLFAKNNITLDGSATVNIYAPGLEWAIINKGQYFYVLYARQLDNNQQVKTEFLYIYKLDKQWKANLKLLTDDIKEGGSAVTVTNILNSPIPVADKTPALMFEELVTDWFNVNLEDFTQIFAQANIAASLDQSNNYKWLTPTATSYAVADTETFDDGIFGMLMMTGGRAGLSTHQVDPNAIPDGCDAAFIISGPRFVQDMLLAGAMEIFGITDSTHFEIDPITGMSVQNVQDISWGPFITTDSPDSTLDSSYSTKLDNSDLSDVTSALDLSDSATIQVMAKGIQWLIIDGDTRYIIQVEDGNLGVYKGATITVPANQFSMTLNNDQVTMKIVNFSYPYSLDYDVYVTYEESWTLGLKEVNGQNIFWFTEVSPPKMTTTVTQTKAAITREVIEGAIAGALALITIIGPIAEGLTATVDVTETTNELNEVSEAVCELNPDNPFDQDEYNALMAKYGELQAQKEAQIAEFQSLGRLTKIGNAASSAKWTGVAKIFAITGSLVAVDLSVDKIIADIANNDPQKHLPNFDAFAEFCIAPYSWPGVSGFDLVSAALANSLVIGLKAKS